MFFDSLGKIKVTGGKIVQKDVLESLSRIIVTFRALDKSLLGDPGTCVESIVTYVEHKSFGSKLSKDIVEDSLAAEEILSATILICSVSVVKVQLQRESE